MGMFKKNNLLFLMVGLFLLANQSQGAICSYSVDGAAWESGNNGKITITNNTTMSITHFSLSWSYDHSNLINGWNGVFPAAGAKSITATQPSWGITIAPSASYSLGVSLNKNGVAETPTVSGDVCSVVGSSSLASSKSASSISSSRKSSSIASSSVGSLKSSSSSSASSLAPVTLKAAANFPIGTALSIWNSNSIYTSAQDQTILFQQFDSVVAENIMKPVFLHPQENTFSWADADNLVQFALGKNLAVHAHTLVWHNQSPIFFENYKNNATGMKAALKNHVDTIVTHFVGKVKSWDVVNEALDVGPNGIRGYRNSVFFQAMQENFIYDAYINARAKDAKVDLYYNDYDIEGFGPKYQALINMLSEMQLKNIPIDGVGFQMHIGIDYPTIENIEKAFQGVVDKNLKIRLSELDVAFNKHFDNQAATYPSLTAAMLATQKERYRQIVTSYRKIVPSCLRGGITVWNISDKDSWLNNLLESPSGIKNPDWPVLFDVNFAPKPAYQGFMAGLTDTSIINYNEKYCPQK